MAGVDRISALPEEIKVSILSRLPITDAVRTSALSRSWHHLWTLLPGFIANFDFTGVPDSQNLILRWTQIVHHLLSSLHSPIRYFVLKYYANARPKQLPGFQHLFDLIFQKGGLRDLFFFCSGPPVRVQLPYFRLLQDLKLFNVDISLPSDFRGFEQLTDLILYKVHISQQDIQSLINGSKKLRIFQCFLLPEDGAPSLSVTFTCPSLKYLCFCFDMNKTEARIISAPCLEGAHVTAPLWSAPPELVWVGAATLKFLADIAQVSYLSLSPCVLMGLSQVGVPHTLRFHQLRCLELSMILSIDQTMHKVFCSLLRSMPLLEILELTCYESMESGKRLYESDPILPDEYKKVDGYLCLDQTLRRVAISMENLRGLKDLMWIIHFMFLNANVLEVIRITYCNEDPMVKSRILEDLRKVEKASSDAQIVFVNVNDVS